MELFNQLLNSIKNYIDEYQLRQKYRQTHEVDISIGKFSDYLLGRVKHCVSESIKIQGEEFEQAVKMLRYGRNIVAIPFSILETSLETRQKSLVKFANPWMRVHESFNLLSDSLLLALSGRYTLAYSSLRSSLESIMQGAFYQGLMDSDNRRKAREILNNTPSNYPSSIGKMVEDVLNEIPVSERNSFNLEIFFDRKLHSISPSPRPPAVSSMLRSIIFFYKFAEFEDPFQYIYNDLYGALSIYTHVAMNATTAWQYSDEEGIEFDSGRVSAKMISDFITWFAKTLDVIGVIFLRAVTGMFEVPGARSTSIRIESEIAKHGSELVLTRKVLYSILGLGR